MRSLHFSLNFQSALMLWKDFQQMLHYVICFWCLKRLYNFVYLDKSTSLNQLQSYLAHKQRFIVSNLQVQNKHEKQLNLQLTWNALGFFKGSTFTNQKTKTESVVY